MGKIRFSALVLAAALIIAAPAGAQNYTPPPYPPGAIPVGASTNGTTGSTSASLPHAAGYTTFACAAIVTSGGTTTPLTVNATLSGLSANFNAGTLNFQYVFVSTGQGKLIVILPNCVPASGLDVGPTLTVPAGGAGTAVALALLGYEMLGSSR